MDSYNSYIGLTLENRYHIKRLVGIGGMAMVFEAEDLLRKMTVAIKILKEDFASDEVSVQRFINESKAVLMLSHPNIVKIFDVSVRGEYKFIVMEYIDGITLKAYMERKGGALSFNETISYSIQILRALEHAHLGGIVHRDIKPQNIMLLKSGQIKVTDFGIAKLPDARTLTDTDKAIGTVYYISPEQAAGERGIDRRTDLYSVGVMMYEMLTGKLPFTGENSVAVALKQINEEPIPPTALTPSIPKGLEQIILFAMEKDKEQRFQTATQMIELLTKVRENPGVVFRQKNSAQKKQQNAAPKKTSMLPIIMGVVAAFLLVTILSGFTLIERLFFSDEANDTETIVIDNFLGQRYDDIAERLEQNELYDIRIEKANRDNDEAGVIYDQKPKADSKQRHTIGETLPLTLYVSLGKEGVVLDDYTGWEYNKAVNALRQAKMTVPTNNRREEYSATVPQGYVIGTDPAAGTALNKGDTVTLIVSLGENVETVDLPNLVGMTTTEAYAALVAADLRLGNINYREDPAPKGTILEQSLHTINLPSEETTVARGVARVDLVISSGQVTTVPNFVGKTLAEAEALFPEDLVAGTVVTIHDDTVEYGVILAQTPAAGTVYTPGTAVNFILSLPEE